MRGYSDPRKALAFLRTTSSASLRFGTFSSRRRPLGATPLCRRYLIRLRYTAAWALKCPVIQSMIGNQGFPSRGSSAAGGDEVVFHPRKALRFSACTPHPPRSSAPSPRRGRLLENRPFVNHAPPLLCKKRPSLKRGGSKGANVSPRSC